MRVAELPDVGLFGVLDRYGDMAIHAAIDLARVFSKDELLAALQATVRDFPVLGCSYAPGFWRDRWAPQDIAQALHYEAASDVDARTQTWVLRTHDPTREPMLRLLGIVNGNKMRIVMTVSHLAVDGAGLAAAGHVFGSHLYGVPPALPVESRRDLYRSLEGLSWWHLPVLARGLVKEGLRPLRQLRAEPRHRPYPDDARAGAGFRHLVISKEQLRELRSRCAGATVNDLLIAALARIAKDRSRGGPCIVTYTMDLRRYGKAPRLMAANTSSILSAIIERDGIGDLAQTTRAVRSHTQNQVASLSGPAFLLGPYALGASAPHALARKFVRAVVPALVDLPLKRGFLMTNVGKVDDGLQAFGDDIEAIRIIGPNVKGVPVPVVVAFGFRDALHIELFAGPGLGARTLRDLETDLMAALELPERSVS